MAEPAARSDHSPAKPCPQPATRWIRWLGPALLALLFAALTIWTWRRWGSPRVDHGQQLYMAWQIAEGSDLYRDITWGFGPFSQYLNALFFRVFGVGYTTLIWCNLGILAGLCTLLHWLLVRLCDRLTAFLGVAAFLSMFAFAQLVNVGNYNFITPYTHDASHGTLLCFIALACVMRSNETGSRLAAAGVGAALAFAALTKPEVILAATGTAVWGLGFCWWLEGRGRWRVLRDLAAFAVGFGVAFGIAVGALAFRTSPWEAAAAVFGAWAPLWYSDISSTHYFQEGLGLDHPWTNLAVAIGSAAVVALGVAVWSELDARRPRGGPAIGWRECAGGALLFAALWIAIPVGPWNVLGRALPLLTLASFGLFVREAFRARDAVAARRFVVLSAWCVLALGLLSKMLLNSRLHQYGFFLAMPSTLILIAASTWWMPSRLAARNGRGGLVRAGVVAVVLAGCIAHLTMSNRFYRTHVSPFGHGDDLILSRGRPGGNAMQTTLERIRALVPPDETFVAMPYGIMLNYQARRRSPSPYMRWTALEFITWGEDSMLSTLERDPPDWVVLIHSASQEEFRLGRFGQDPRNGKALVAWIDEHYETVERIGAEPFRSHRFGAKIMRRAGAATERRE